MASPAGTGQAALGARSSSPVSHRCLGPRHVDRFFCCLLGALAVSWIGSGVGRTRTSSCVRFCHCSQLVNAMCQKFFLRWFFKSEILFFKTVVCVCVCVFKDKESSSICWFTPHVGTAAACANPDKDQESGSPSWSRT